MLDLTAGKPVRPLVYGDPHRAPTSALGARASRFLPRLPLRVPAVGNVIQIRTAAAGAGRRRGGHHDRRHRGDGGGNPNNYPPLRDNFVPFAYVDATARNGFQYSTPSRRSTSTASIPLPSSQQSAMVTQSVTPTHQRAGVLGSLGTLQSSGPMAPAQPERGAADA